MMPGLFAVAIHPALAATQAELQGDERLYAFLDDAYMTCDPERVCANFQVLQHALICNANIDLNLGKARVWNAAGEEPPGLTQLLPPAQAHGDPVLPLSNKESTRLAPCGACCIPKGGAGCQML